MQHKECDSALHRSSLHTELRLEGLPCLWLPPNCAQPSVTFVPRSTKCSGNGSECRRAPVLGILPFESQILACLFFTSFQFRNPSVFLKLFDAFSVLALADCSACIYINQIEFTYNVSFPIL